jgi:hypothetical protein
MFYLLIGVKFLLLVELEDGHSSTLCNHREVGTALFERLQSFLKVLYDILRDVEKIRVCLHHEVNQKIPRNLM